MVRAVEPSSHQRGRVLVIDDSDTARQMMADLLREADFEVYEQGSPIGATRAILRNDIQIVVIDVNMPAMRGDKLAVLFRENPRFAHLVLVLVSSRPRSELEELGAAARADAVVQKKTIHQDLVDVVTRLFHHAA